MSIQKIRLRHPVEITFVLNSKRVCLEPVSFIQQVDLLFVYHDLVINKKTWRERTSTNNATSGEFLGTDLGQG